MPLYDFLCPRCGERFEARTAVGEASPPCPDCGGEDAERIITGFGTSRSPGLHGAAAQRSHDRRRAREEQRAVRRDQRRNRPL